MSTIENTESKVNLVKTPFTITDIQNNQAFIYYDAKDHQIFVSKTGDKTQKIDQYQMRIEGTGKVIAIAGKVKTSVGEALAYFDTDPENKDNKPVLAFIHGNSACKESIWSLLQSDVGQELAKNYRIIGFDALGHGQSDDAKDIGSYSYYQAGEVYIDALKKMGIEKSTILGWSMGGHIANGAILTRSENIDGIIAVGSPPFSSQKGDRFRDVFGDIVRYNAYWQMAAPGYLDINTAKFFAEIQDIKPEHPLYDLFVTAGLRTNGDARLYSVASATVAENMDELRTEVRNEVLPNGCSIAKSDHEILKDKLLNVIIPAAEELNTPTVNQTKNITDRKVQYAVIAGAHDPAAGNFSQIERFLIGGKPFSVPDSGHSVFMAKPEEFGKQLGVVLQNILGLENRRSKILFIGDSFTVGTGLGDPKEAFPFQLVQALKEKAIKADIEMQAIDGHTTKHLLGALDVTHPTSNPDHPNHGKDSYDLVVLSIGINDLFRGDRETDYQTHFGQLLDRAVLFANNKASKVVVVSIPAWDASPSVESKDGTDYRLHKYQQVRDNTSHITIPLDKIIFEADGSIKVNMDTRELQAKVERAKIYNTENGIAQGIDRFNRLAHECITNKFKGNGPSFIDITQLTRFGDDGITRPDKAMFAEDGIHYSGRMYKKWVDLSLPVIEKILGNPPLSKVNSSKYEPFSDSKLIS